MNTYNHRYSQHNYCHHCQDLIHYHHNHNHHNNHIITTTNIIDHHHHDNHNNHHLQIFKSLTFTSNFFVVNIIIINFIIIYHHPSRCYPILKVRVCLILQQYQYGTLMSILTCSIERRSTDL